MEHSTPRASRSCGSSTRQWPPVPLRRCSGSFPKALSSCRRSTASHGPSSPARQRLPRLCARRAYRRHVGHYRRSNPSRGVRSSPRSSTLRTASSMPAGAPGCGESSCMLPGRLPSGDGARTVDGARGTSFLAVRPQALYRRPAPYGRCIPCLVEARQPTCGAATTQCSRPVARMVVAASHARPLPLYRCSARALVAVGEHTSGGWPQEVRRFRFPRPPEEHRPWGTPLVPATVPAAGVARSAFALISARRGPRGQGSRPPHRLPPLRHKPRDRAPFL